MGPSRPRYHERMADQQYRTFNLVNESRGVTARYVDDAAPESTYLNMQSVEEVEENALGSRLGSQIINRTGTAINVLPASVHSLAKLAGLNGTAWRYAGCGSSLYRRTGLSQGPYTVLSTMLSGQPWQGVVYRPELSSIPYLFIADQAGMLKDNGSFAAPQQMGIFQPQYPVLAQATAPNFSALDNYTSSVGYIYTGIAGGTLGTYVSTTTTSAVLSTGVQSVGVADPKQPGPFQLLTIDTGANQETVLVLQVTATGFIANFTKTHGSGVAVTSADLSVSVPGNTTATISKSFGLPFAVWPTTLQQQDYIGLYVFVSDPSQIQSITLKFDCGDGSFDSDFFYRVISQGPQQSFLDTLTTPTVAAADAIISESLNIYGNDENSVSGLNTGLQQWTPLLIQLSDFAGAGRASFTDPVHNWAAVNGYQIEIVTNQAATVTVSLAALVLFGGYGADSFAGVGYDYVFTFYNAVDGTESNPSMIMTNINPPLNTNWVYPRRQPVLLTMNHPTLDNQVTHLRIYRRGGTLADNYRRIAQIVPTGIKTNYVDVSGDIDIQQADTVSFVNDVPVTSTLPVPVNTALTALVSTKNQVVNVPVSSTANISVGQQVTIGSIPINLLDTSETVVVLAVGPSYFTAFVQNTHQPGELVSATAKYGQPMNIMAQGYSQMWFAGDPNNPHYLYFSTAYNPQAVGSANYIEVGTPDDPITAIVQLKGNLYVSTQKFWWAIAPGTNQGTPPTVYPTAAKHGCVAPLGYIVTEEGIFYQAIDGIRFFAGGASAYLTQEQEFIFQNVGPTPIVGADPTQLSQTRSAYWNNMLFFSYIGTDSARHRLIYHALYKRWRNDNVDCQSILLEADTNTLLYGTSGGLTKIDRVGYYDEANNAGTLVNGPIAFDLQWSYKDQGMPAEQKIFQELTIDCDTGGQSVTPTLKFDDGNVVQVLAPFSTSGRQRFNITLNAGQGFTGYKVSLELTGNAVTSRIFFYQVAVRALPLAKTRKSLDTYQLSFSESGSKICKNLFVQYSSTTPVTGTVTYDDPSFLPFTFTLPATGGVRNDIRVRLPAVNFRYLRLVMTAGSDFQVWEESRFEVKNLAVGKGYSFFGLLNVEK